MDDRPAEAKGRHEEADDQLEKMSSRGGNGGGMKPKTERNGKDEGENVTGKEIDMIHR